MLGKTLKMFKCVVIIVGSLLYSTITWPNIAYTVGAFYGFILIIFGGKIISWISKKTCFVFS
jgi:membrane-associated HD superfamily phosphohydrolase